MAEMNRMASYAICSTVVGVDPVVPPTPTLSNVTTRRFDASASINAQQYTLPSEGGVLGDVGHPQLIGSDAGEPSSHQILAAHVSHARAARQAPSRSTLDAELAHDLRDGVVADDDLTAEPQLGGDAMGSVDTAGITAYLGDLGRQEDTPQRPR